MICCLCLLSFKISTHMTFRNMTHLFFNKIPCPNSRDSADLSCRTFFICLEVSFFVIISALLKGNYYYYFKEIKSSILKRRLNLWKLQIYAAILNKYIKDFYEVFNISNQEDYCAKCF